MFYRHLSPAFGVVVWLAATNFALAVQEPKLSDEPNLTDGQEEEFLLKTQVVNSRQITKGITHPWRLTLSDGTLTRELHRAISNRTREEWAAREYDPIELRGKTAVVIGVGGIGTQIAVRAHACGMRVIGVDPRDMPYVPFLQKTTYPDRLDAVLPEVDVVFVAAPHTRQSEGMISAKEFALMKQNSYFIAVSRGKLYDTAAAGKALETKRLAGAGLDVTDPEPVPKGHPLWKFENVIITPKYRREVRRGGPALYCPVQREPSPLCCR